VSKQDAYYGKFPEGKVVTATYENIAYYPLDSLPDYVNGGNGGNGGGGDRPTKTENHPTKTGNRPTRTSTRHPSPQPDPTTARPDPTPTPTGDNGGRPTFVDEFSGAIDTSKWYVSDYPPSELFASSWSKNQVRAGNGQLQLVIDQQGCPNGCGGKKWRAGEIASLKKYTYGYLETTFIPACSTGGISSLFTYADAPGGAEIDIEFEGGAKNCTGVSYTHYANGKTFGWGVKSLGFNAREKMHTYGFLWTPQRIDWYVDHKLHFSTAGQQTSVPSASMNLMINNWVVSKQDAYYGKFPEGKVVTATYDRVAYYPLNALPNYVKA